MVCLDCEIMEAKDPGGVWGGQPPQEGPRPSKLAAAATTCRLWYVQLPTLVTPFAAARIPSFTRVTVPRASRAAAAYLNVTFVTVLRRKHRCS